MFLKYNNIFYKVLKKFILKIKYLDNDFNYYYIKKEFLYNFYFILKKSFLFQFKNLVDICCIDFLFKKNRFLLIYNSLSFFLNLRVFVCIFVKINSIYPYGNGVFSLYKLYSSVNWLEREIWDLFGIFFFHHNDLRRLLSDYGFFGFPLRKDYPLSGYKEIRYDDIHKVIVNEDLNLTQEFRSFNFLNPWS